MNILIIIPLTFAFAIGDDGSCPVGQYVSCYTAANLARICNCKTCPCNLQGIESCGKGGTPCNCKPVYTGKKCKECKPKWYLSGDTCKPCPCNSHGIKSCGKGGTPCNCKKGYKGEKCEGCKRKWYRNKQDVCCPNTHYHDGNRCRWCRLGCHGPGTKIGTCGSGRSTCTCRKQYYGEQCKKKCPTDCNKLGVKANGCTKDGWCHCKDGFLPPKCFSAECDYGFYDPGDGNCKECNCGSRDGEVKNCKNGSGECFCKGYEGYYMKKGKCRECNCKRKGVGYSGECDGHTGKCACALGYGGKECQQRLGK